LIPRWNWLWVGLIALSISPTILAAERIVSLAPHLTEMLFLIGAGDRVVGTVAHSDRPPEAARLPQIGSATHVDLERLLQLQPDRVLAWETGTAPQLIEKIEARGIRVTRIGSEHLEGLADDLRVLGQLSGREAAAETIALNFLDGLRGLRDSQSARAPVRVFYQVWDRPLMTVNAAHFIGQAIAICGGENIFADLDTLIPRVDLESVLMRQPELIVTGGPGEDDPAWLEPWKHWNSTGVWPTVRVEFIPPSLLQRPTPGMLEGIQWLCASIAEVRSAQSPLLEP
jgi:iron complex transport system substrate-binding protein